MKQLNLIDYLTKKQCSRCGEIKPISEFNADKKNKDKLQFQCQKCEKKWGTSL